MRKTLVILGMVFVMMVTTGMNVKACWTKESKEQIESNYAFEIALITNHDDGFITDHSYNIQFLDNDTYLFNYYFATNEGNSDYGLMIVNKDGRVIKGMEIYKGEVFGVRQDVIDGYCK